MRCLWLRRAGVATFLSLASLASSGQARDFVLTIGGGYSPLGNQASIERNAIYFGELIAERLPGARHDILFSDGNSPGRDVQYRAAEGTISRSWSLLAQVFQQEKNWGMRYRSHQVPGVRGAATRENLSTWFRDIAEAATDGDRVLIYAAAHGGVSADKNNPQDTALYLWNSQRLTAKEFAAYLDTIKPSVKVVVVMAQCHAGGFANAALDGITMPDGSVSPRCGFFATTFDRPAAGCTPDVEGDNEHEYSSYFWAALRGRGRDGQPMPVVDYDGDGGTSLAEAHTFAVIQAQSIDIPLRTSEAFLQRIAPSGASNLVGPFSIHMPYDRLRETADPAQLAALDSLSSQLQLMGADRGGEVLDLAARAVEDRRSSDELLKETAAEYQKLCQNIRTSLVTRWPELANPWNAQLAAVIDDEGKAIVQLIERHRDYAAFVALREKRQQLLDNRWRHDRLFAKSQRLLRVLEDVAVVGNLRLNGPSEPWRRYQELVALENQPLLPASMPAAADIR
ncbi:MAG: hypothetical protein WD875_08010 [Pirellulales bacterium]